MHGCQGCTAFGKALFVKHFREPAFFNTTALSESDVIMDGTGNVLKGLEKIFEKNMPHIVGIVTTGLTEVKGDDVKEAIERFRKLRPDLNSVPIIPVSTPDYGGTYEQGYAKAVSALIEGVVTEGRFKNPQRINLLPGVFMTAADTAYLKGVISSFRLESFAIPDISGSLGGFLRDELSFIQSGGLLLTDLMDAGSSLATFSIGESMKEPAMVMRERTQVENYHFNNLFGLGAFDEFLTTLSKVTGRPVPEFLSQEREQLLDAMVDAHFYIGQKKFLLALEPDLLFNMANLIVEAGGEIEAAVSPVQSPLLKEINAKRMIAGDLYDLESDDLKADMVISNSNGTFAALKHKTPLLRMGFPVTDRLGVNQKVNVGYRGAMNLLFEIANLFLEEKQ
jgi:nitrogenase molybdenum-iron cofactor biosynthesis protein NifN